VLSFEVQLSMQEFISRALDRKKILIMVAACLAVFIAFRALYQLYENYSQSLQTRVETLQLKYENLQRLMKNRDPLSKLNTSLKSFHASLAQNSFIPGSTSSLAQAQFQKIVKEMAEQNNINIRVTKMLDMSDFNQYKLVRMQISARSEIGSINNFIQSLRSNPRYVFIQELEIKRINNRENRFYYINAQLIGLTES
jgi:hypothetical protein